MCLKEDNKQLKLKQENNTPEVKFYYLGRKIAKDGQQW